MAIDQRALGCTQQRKSIFPFSSVQQTFIERLLRARWVLGWGPSSSSLPHPRPSTEDTLSWHCADPASRVRSPSADGTGPGPALEEDSPCTPAREVPG